PGEQSQSHKRRRPPQLRQPLRRRLPQLHRPRHRPPRDPHQGHPSPRNAREQDGYEPAQKAREHPAVGCRDMEWLELIIILMLIALPFLAAGFIIGYATGKPTSPRWRHSDRSGDDGVRWHWGGRIGRTIPTARRFAGIIWIQPPM